MPFYFVILPCKFFHFTFFLLDLWIYLCQKLGSGSYLLNDSIKCYFDWFPRCVFTIFWKCWITFDRIDNGITNWLVKLFRCETMIGTCVCNRRENHESIYILYVHYIVCGIENGLFQQGQASQTSGKNYVCI